MGPLTNGHSWLINGGDPNHLLSGMILQVPAGNFREVSSPIYQPVKVEVIPCLPYGGSELASFC